MRAVAALVALLGLAAGCSATRAETHTYDYRSQYTFSFPLASRGKTPRLTARQALVKAVGDMGEDAATYGVLRRLYSGEPLELAVVDSSAAGPALAAPPRRGSTVAVRVSLLRAVVTEAPRSLGPPRRAPGDPPPTDLYPETVWLETEWDAAEVIRRECPVAKPESAPPHAFELALEDYLLRHAELGWIKFHRVTPDVFPRDPAGLRKDLDARLAEWVAAARRRFGGK